MFKFPILPQQLEDTDVDGSGDEGVEQGPQTTPKRRRCSLQGTPTTTDAPTTQTSTSTCDVDCDEDPPSTSANATASTTAAASATASTTTTASASASAPGRRRPKKTTTTKEISMIGLLICRMDKIQDRVEDAPEEENIGVLPPMDDIGAHAQALEHRIRRFPTASIQSMVFSSVEEHVSNWEKRMWTPQDAQMADSNRHPQSMSPAARQDLRQDLRQEQRRQSFGNQSHCSRPQQQPHRQSHSQGSTSSAQDPYWDGRSSQGSFMNYLGDV